MRDPITKVQFPASGHGHKSSDYGANGSGRGQNKHRTWRDNCCWRFNRNGKCDRSGCTFDNRCSYCGGWTHYAAICKKKGASGEESGRANGGGKKK